MKKIQRFVKDEMHNCNSYFCVNPYMPVSEVAVKELGKLANGTIGATLPNLEKIMNVEGAKLMTEYIKRYGPTTSGVPVVPTTFESFRLLNEARLSKRTLDDLTKDPLIMSKSFIGPYTFDASGAIQGLNFVLKEVKDGKLFEISEE